MSKKRKECIFFVLVGLITGFINGFFGGGGGMVCVPLLEKICNMEEKQAHATALCLILPLSIVSSFIYIYQNDLNFLFLIIITLGSVIGGFFGAKLLVKINSKVLRIIFAVLMLFVGVKSILW